MARPAVFLDRDGTVIVDRHFAFRPDAIELVPGAVEALRRLRSAGYLLVLVTNQSGVARGYFDEEDVRRFHHHLQALLARQAAPLDACYYCPHHTEGVVVPYAIRCACRKPAPGLLYRARDDLGLDLHRSWLVGDTVDDVGAALAAGCRPVLLGEDGTPAPAGVAVASSLAEAAEIILDGEPPYERTQ